MCSGLAATVGGGRSPQSATGSARAREKESKTVLDSAVAGVRGEHGCSWKSLVCLRAQREWESETLAGGGLRWQSAARWSGARYSRYRVG